VTRGGFFLDDHASDAIRAFRLGLTRLNIGDQKQVFDRLPPALKAALWRDRIADAAAKATSLEQKDILARVAKRITPAIYDDRDAYEGGRFDRFWQRLQPRARAAFAQHRLSLNAISTLLGEANGTPPINAGRGKPPCGCSIAARQTDCDDCDDDSNCKRVPCVSSKTGCGCWWRQPCDGVCR